MSAVERRKVKDFYDNTLYTRLHEDDLVGHVTAKEAWEISAIPAIAPGDQDYRTGPTPHEVYRRSAGEVIDPQREDRPVLDQVRRTLGSMNFAAQYQQDPVPPDDNAIRRQWLRYYDVPPQLDLVLANWDTALTCGETSDYTKSH